MKPRRFFMEGEPLSHGTRRITGKTARHISRVLRLGVKERIVLFDGSGFEFPAEILEVGRDWVRLRVATGRLVNRESPLTLRLGMGICQPATMDLVIQKVTELGVAEIVPVRSQRAQKWVASEEGSSRYRRWERIAQDAARQSGRNQIPRISPPVDFPQVLSQMEATEIQLIFWEGEVQGSLKQVLSDKAQSRQANVLIGPEGGFSPEEVAQAATAGFQSISLGRRLLRTETAAITVVSLMQYELGDLGLHP